MCIYRQVTDHLLEEVLMELTLWAVWYLGGSRLHREQCVKALLLREVEEALCQSFHREQVERGLCAILNKKALCAEPALPGMCRRELHQQSGTGRGQCLLALGEHLCLSVH